MSILDVREAMEGLPGAETTVMSYEEGGAIEVFSIGGISVKCPAGTPYQAVREELRLAIEKQS